MSDYRTIGTRDFFVCVASDFASVRVWDRGLVVRSPRYAPLFSERNGIDRPLLSWRGWRLFAWKDAAWLRELRRDSLRPPETDAL